MAGKGQVYQPWGITLSIGWLCHIKVEAPGDAGTHLHKATQMLMFNLGHCFLNTLMTVKSMRKEGEVSRQKYSVIIIILL